MLRKNPLAPPRSAFTTAFTVRAGATGRAAAFVSAEDFDDTGILAGLDPCESRYWWVPELATADVVECRPADHATRSVGAAPAAEA